MCLWGYQLAGIALVIRSLLIMTSVVISPVLFSSSSSGILFHPQTKLFFSGAFVTCAILALPQLIILGKNMLLFGYRQMTEDLDLCVATPTICPSVKLLYLDYITSTVDYILSQDMKWQLGSPVWTAGRFCNERTPWRRQWLYVLRDSEAACTALFCR